MIFIKKDNETYTLNNTDYSISFLSDTLKLENGFEILNVSPEEFQQIKNEFIDSDLSSDIKEKKDLHLFRKFFHMLPGLLLIYLIQFKVYPTYLIIVVLGFLFLISALIESIRIKYRKVNELAIGISKYFIRKEELKELSGIPFYIAGCFISLLAFGKDIASLSILYLAIGDPVASFFGILWGEHSKKFKNGKSLIGTLGNIAICTCLTIIYGTVQGWDLQIIYQISLFGGMISGFTEAFAPEEINDNVFIPVVSALLLSMVFSNFMIVPK
jgi:dolichol kinase